MVHWWYQMVIQYFDIYYGTEYTILMYNLHGTPWYFNKVHVQKYVCPMNMFVSVVSFSPCIRVFKAQIQRADHSSLIRQWLLHVCVLHAQESSQQFGELHCEKQVNTRIGNTVQAGQQHEDGKGCSWKIKLIYWLDTRNYINNKSP